MVKGHGFKTVDILCHIYLNVVLKGVG